MEPILKSKWRKLDGARIDLPIMDAVENALIKEKELGNQIKVCIGTDSQVRGLETEFATVIVILRKGRGGFMFINNDKTKNKMSLKERLLI
jgi:hypothetical protein